MQTRCWCHQRQVCTGGLGPEARGASGPGPEARGGLGAGARGGVGEGAAAEAAGAAGGGGGGGRSAAGREAALRRELQVVKRKRDAAIRELRSQDEATRRGRRRR
jgi:hypothetical protein